MDNLNELRQEYQALLSAYNPEVVETDYAVLKKYIPFLENLDAIERSAISIFDLNRSTHVYASPTYRARLGISDSDHALTDTVSDDIISGSIIDFSKDVKDHLVDNIDHVSESDSKSGYNDDICSGDSRGKYSGSDGSLKGSSSNSDSGGGNAKDDSGIGGDGGSEFLVIDDGIEGFERLMHPDDLIQSYRMGLYFLKFGLGMPAGQFKKYKLIQDFRIKHGPGKWIRVLEQHSCLETDKNGKPWLSLSILDVSPYQDPDTPYRAALINIDTGEVQQIPADKTGTDENDSLSGREKEILSLISEGFVSKQIADKLYLSVHTVNTHRRNIIGKMKVSNTAEAIRQAKDMALI
jgi:DNA-binding CsgD family transcriptional regulator